MADPAIAPPENVHSTPAPGTTARTAADTAILAATERLLADHTLHELSASAIIEAAGISRPTFYSYYPSKFAVVAALLRQVFDEVFESVQPWLTDARAGSAPDSRPELVLRSILRSAAVLLHRHGAIIRAAHENARTDAEIGTEWFSIMQRFRSALRRELLAVRGADSGGSPAGGSDVELLASTLIWSSERVFYLSTASVDPVLDTPEAAVEGLLSIWVPAIYGVPYRPPTD